MGRTRFMQAGDQARHRPERPIRRDDEIRPTLAWRCRRTLVRHRLERADDRRPDGEDTTAFAPCGIDAFGGVARHAVVLLVWRLVILLTCDAGMQDDRRYPDAARDEAGHEFRRERAARRRHLGTARLRGEYRLVHRKRP